MRNPGITFAALCAGLLLAIAPAFAEDDIVAAGRQIVTRYQGAIVTIQMVVKTSMSYPGEDTIKREMKTEAAGTVIDPSGLVVVSLSTTSPAEMMEQMSQEEDSDFSISSEMASVNILLPNGKELPAKIVLRDKDLDLAFLRPKEKLAEPLTAVDLTKAAKPGLLDQTVMVFRMGTVASRAVGVCCDRVQGIVEKPRTFYVPGMQSLGGSLGAPVFATDGNPIGILLFRIAPRGSSDVARMSGMGSNGMMYVILPAQDVLEAAKQATDTAEAASKK